MTKATKKAPAQPASAQKPAPKAASTPKAEAASEGAYKIGKTGLVEHLTAQTNLSRIEAASVVDAVLDVVIEALKTGKSVGLPGLGTFSVRETAARQGVHPGTAEKIQIPAGKKVSYKVASDLKKAL